MLQISLLLPNYFANFTTVIKLLNDLPNWIESFLGGIPEAKSYILKKKFSTFRHGTEPKL